MKHWSWRFLLFSAPLLSGCGRSMVATAPAPPVDATVPEHTETATFALG
jgi:hypothetical protein